MTQPEESTVSLAAGHRLGAYEIIRPLGSGAFADVYLARQVTLNHPVALKVIRRAEAETSETQGAQIMCRLRHPGIVRVEFADRIDGRLTIAMEYVDGRTLRQILDQEGPLPLARAISIATATGEALDALNRFDHDGSKGLAHLDLKPSNLLIDRSGSVKITDFGIAQIFRHETESEGGLAGSPAYMAPEQFGGRPCLQSDFWAVGVLLYLMLTGETPLKADTLAGYWAQARGIEGRLPELLKRIPEPMRPIVTRCLAVDPAKRYASAAGLVAALKATGAPPAPDRACGKCGSRLLDGSDICPECTYAPGPDKGAAEPKSSVLQQLRPAKRPAARGRFWWAAAVLAAAVLAVGAFYPPCREWVAAHVPHPALAIAEHVPLRSTEGNGPGRSRAEEDWGRIGTMEASVEGDYEQRIQALTKFVAAYPNAAETVTARDRLQIWQDEARLFAGTERIESSESAHISEKLSAWDTFMAQRKTDFRKSQAQERLEHWQQQLDDYDGFAELTVVSAAGLPPAGRVLGASQPDPFFQILEEGKVLYHSKTLKANPAPHWNEKLRVHIQPDAAFLLEIRDKNLIGSHLVLQENLTHFPRDGPFKVADGAMEVDMMIEREH